MVDHLRSLTREKNACMCVVWTSLSLLLSLGVTNAYSAPPAGPFLSASSSFCQKAFRCCSFRAHNQAHLQGFNGVPGNTPFLSGVKGMSASFGIPAYLQRIGLELSAPARIPCYSTLVKIMEAQSRTIPFENLDVVQRKIIAISPAEVEEKLVSKGRGGYCFEQNQLLASALLSIGFDVSPMLCRVRWNKADEEQTTFTHVALSVKLGGQGSADGGPIRTYLADVGFAGTNSIAPVLLGSEEPQDLPEGKFRTIRDSSGYTTLQWNLKQEWRSLYMFKEEACLPIDLELANWWSCTYPKARFTSQFFVARVVGQERHHILNETYVIRKEDGSVESERISSKDRLLDLLTSVFGISLPHDTQDLDRYLHSSTS